MVFGKTLKIKKFPAKRGKTYSDNKHITPSKKIMSTNSKLHPGTAFYLAVSTDTVLKVACREVACVLQGTKPIFVLLDFSGSMNP